MHSLFSASGARKSKHTLPNEREGFALAVGASMQWSKLRDSSNPMFFHNIVEEVKRCEGTERDWSKEQMVHFVQAKLFGGIPQYAVEKWIQSEFLGKRGDEITEHRKALIEVFIYRYLASVDSGVDSTSALALAEKAHIQEVLQCKGLGGRADWVVEDFISEEVWNDLGGKAGLKAQSKKLLTLIAAAGRKVHGQYAPIDPYCKDCGELKFQHQGDRCKLEPVPCGCGAEPLDNADGLRRPPPGGEPPRQRQRGMNELDRTGQGILETYQRKLKARASLRRLALPHRPPPSAASPSAPPPRPPSAASCSLRACVRHTHAHAPSAAHTCSQVIATRYPELEPKAVVSKLLGSDIDTDDHEDDESVGVTGKQGGRLLACYLFSVKDDAALTFLAQGIKAWLEAQLPKYAVVHPVQTSCLKNAVSSSCPSWSVAWPPQPPHVRPRLTLATTRSSRRHAAHVRHRLRRPHTAPA